jgi:hypothetical protein
MTPTHLWCKETIMRDTTEAVRRELLAEINAQPGSREALETEHGQVWNTQELGQDFEVLGFAAPLVVVRRRSDGALGSLFFQHSPRFFFGFELD